MTCSAARPAAVGIEPDVLIKCAGASAEAAAGTGPRPLLSAGRSLSQPGGRDTSPAAPVRGGVPPVTRGSWDADRPPLCTGVYPGQKLAAGTGPRPRPNKGTVPGGPRLGCVPSESQVPPGAGSSLCIARSTLPLFHQLGWQELVAFGSSVAWQKSQTCAPGPGQTLAARASAGAPLDIAALHPCVLLQLNQSCAASLWLC